jgi:Na+-transporting NADH:ubiquinone oxidoreductase subunit NqrF
MDDIVQLLYRRPIPRKSGGFIAITVPAPLNMFADANLDGEYLEC